MDIANPQSLNRYSYVLNNPVNAVDPTGKFCMYVLGPFVHIDNQASQDCSSGGQWVSGTASSASYGSDGLVQIGFTNGPWAGGVVGFCYDSCLQAVSDASFQPWLYNTPPMVSGDGSVGGGGGGTGTMQSLPLSQASNKPASQEPQPCGPRSGTPAMGDSISVTTVNPFTSGDGAVAGKNRQSFGSTTNKYSYSGHGAGLDVGVSIQSVWAWGSGSWTGPFRSVNFSAGPFAGSLFWTPGKGGWVGFSWGLAAGLPGLAYEETTYTCGYSG